MKKTLVAMAALAAVSAFAQSSVTLYGRIDNWVGQTRTQLGTAPAVSNIVVNGGGYTGPRWGMRGSEDLGGGLKANFNLEGRYGADDGSAGSDGLFGRQSWVGFSGGFGEVKMGRTTTPMDDYNGTGSAHVAFDIFANQRNTLRGTSAGLGIGLGFDARFSNGIKYDTPNLGGFTAKVHIGLGEGKTGATSGAGASAGNDFGVGAGYANGPLAVNFVHQQDNDTNPSTKAEKFNSLNASYDFGVIAISGAVDADSQDQFKYRGYSIGVSVPIGAAKIGAGYNRATTKVGAAKDDKGTGFGLVAEYALSKRTRVYGGLTEAKTKTSTGAKIASGRAIALGVRHDF
jgi:predicted porin